MPCLPHDPTLPARAIALLQATHNLMTGPMGVSDATASRVTNDAEACAIVRDFLHMPASHGAYAAMTLAFLLSPEG